MSKPTINPEDIKNPRLARALGIQTRTLYQWKRSRPKVYAALKEWYICKLKEGLREDDTAEVTSDTEKEA